MEDFKLSIEDVSYKVKNFTILNQITAHATAKQGLVLKGESGLGKTTLIKLLAGLEQPSSGAIYYNFTNISAMSVKERAHFRRQFMGIAFQNPHIIPSLNVEQNIHLAMEIHQPDHWSGKKRVQEMMERFEIDHRKKAYIGTLSGGEARRVALARAFINTPKIVLLDEPLTGFDQEMASRVSQTISEIKAETGALIVVATHNMKIAKVGSVKLDFDQLPKTAPELHNSAADAKLEPPKSEIVEKLRRASNAHAIATANAEISTQPEPIAEPEPEIAAPATKSAIETSAKAAAKPRKPRAKSAPKRSAKSATKSTGKTTKTAKSSTSEAKPAAKPATKPAAKTSSKSPSKGKSAAKSSPKSKSTGKATKTAKSSASASKTSAPKSTRKSTTKTSKPTTKSTGKTASKAAPKSTAKAKQPAKTVAKSVPKTATKSAAKSKSTAKTTKPKTSKAKTTRAKGRAK